MAPNKSPSTNQRTLVIPTTPDGPPHEDLAPFGVVRQLAMVKADVATSISGESCEDDDLHDPDRHTAPVLKTAPGRHVASDVRGEVGRSPT